jgi:hypothetical protein
LELEAIDLIEKEVMGNKAEMSHHGWESDL